MARQALENGDTKLAVTLARGLLQADPDDPYALFLLARALETQGKRGEGRRVAARAFRASKAKPDRFMAAQMAARMAYADQRYGAAQYWLRRSLDPAPTKALHDQAVADFKRVRRENPWSTRYRITMQPSDNVNSGSDNPYFMIDGLPWIGVHSADALALSGTIIRLEARSSYRLRENATSATRLTGLASVKRVRLSEQAKRDAPDASGSDFSSDQLELGVSHIMAAGDTEAGRGIIGLNAAIGKTWYGGDPSYMYGKIGVSRRLPLGKSTALSLAAEYERREDETSRFARSDHVQIRADLRHRFENGGQFTFGLIMDKADSDRGNVDATHKTAYASYGFPDMLGPVSLSVTLGARDTDFPRYFIGTIAVPDGRQEETVFGSIDLTFTEIDYAGFVPKLSVTAQSTSSNISRFDTRSTALSFGIESKF